MLLLATDQCALLRVCAGARRLAWEVFFKGECPGVESPGELYTYTDSCAVAHQDRHHVVHIVFRWAGGTEEPSSERV